MQTTKLDLKNIKHLIFDFGGVIINIDYYALVGAFKGLGIQNFDALFSQAKQTNLFDDYEKGLISDENFISEIKKISGLNVSNEQIIDAWNAILLDLPKERLDLIKDLKTKYNTFLLSNTNDLHIKSFEADIDKTIGLDYFYSSFNKIYYSSQIKMRKPDTEIFQFVLDSHQLNPAETIFIDDSIQHVEGAKAVGLNAVWLAPGVEIFELF